MMPLLGWRLSAERQEAWPQRAPWYRLHMADTPDMPLDIPAEQRAEYDAIIALLLENARPEGSDARRHAEAIARACLAPGHLWRAMGLDGRDAIRAIFRDHFPALYAANDKDMRWKKFIYKRLCGWEGFHT